MMGNRDWRGVADGVIFRKLGCGIEGKWKGGLERVSCVPVDTRLPQRDWDGMWICGLSEWKGWFGAV
jgi:hypothetical protein